MVKNPWAGKLVLSYDVMCADCEKPARGLGRTIREAEQALVTTGWRKDRLWRCQKCNIARFEDDDS